jgi:hypothetical protein
VSDLISRKALMDVFQEKADDNTGLLRNNMLFAKELVKSIPTAFDVDKAVEQLKECERYVYDAVSDEDNYVIDTEKAIEIVKGAVKDESSNIIM